MIKKLQQMNISVKLIISFSLIIAMCLGVAMYSYVAIRRMDTMYRYKIHNMEARNVLLLEFHQELTEFRRLLKASYYNPFWIENSDLATRRMYEEFIAQSHLRMMGFADYYISSVTGDLSFIERSRVYSYADLLEIMDGVINFADVVFGLFRDNFFIGGNESYYKGNVLDYTHIVEDNIRYLRRIGNLVGISIQGEIETTMAITQVITTTVLLLASILSFGLAMITVKALAGRVKDMEETTISSIQESTTAQANTQAKSRFLARMSHEIRTPISAVQGIAEIQLQKHSLPREIEDAFNRIYSSSNVLIGIVNDILDMSKIEAGKMDLTLAEYDVAGMVQDIIQMHVVALDSKKFKLKISVDENLPAVLNGDVLRIKQVLNNIMSNAFKYTEHGLVHFAVKVEPSQRQGHIELVTVISDTGRGMTKEQIESLRTEEYMRFHEQEIPSVQGTGLGMPIMFSLVELMGANINIRSKVHAGTIVTVKIPQRLAKEEPGKIIGGETAHSLERFETSAKKLDFVPEPMPHGKVLVVDDVDTNLYVAKGLLGLYELQIETVSNATDAINKIKDGKIYDIVFMDHMMPDLNGIDAAKILRGIGYTYPIVALTANALVGQAEVFVENGFDGFIAKPIKTIELHRILTRFIKPTDGTASQMDSVDSAAAGEADGQEDSDSQAVSDYYNDPSVQSLVYQEFMNTQQNAMTDIYSALSKNDMENARRLSHTIKTFAQIMQEPVLFAKSESVEGILSEGGVPSDASVSELGSEMSAVIDKVTKALREFSEREAAGK